jgi:cytoskeletal protein RodZ
MRTAAPIGAAVFVVLAAIVALVLVQGDFFADDPESEGNAQAAPAAGASADPTSSGSASSSASPAVTSATPTPTSTPTPSATPTATPTATTTPKPAATPKPKPAATPKPARAAGLRLTATGTCWIRIRGDGRIIAEGTLRKGAERTFNGYREYDLILGNAGGVRYSVAGSTPRYRGDFGTPMRFTVVDRRVPASD